MSYWRKKSKNLRIDIIYVSKFELKKQTNAAGSNKNSSYQMITHLVITSGSCETVTTTSNSSSAAAGSRIALEMDGLLDLVETVLENSEPE